MTTTSSQLSTLSAVGASRILKSRIGSTLSFSEVHYILEGCRDNIRLDGRKRDELRPYTLVGQDTLVLSNGSARILLAGGATNVLCSVKADLVHPSPLQPKKGVIELHVDTLLGKRRRGRQGDDEVLEPLLKDLLLQHLVNLEELCVVPHYYVWRLGIDLLVLSGSGGSLVDVCSRVIRQALLGTKLPHVIPSATKETSSGKSSATMDLVTDGDYSKAQDLPCGSCPIVVTVNVMKTPPNSSVVLVVDATLEEEACASCQVRVAVDPDGNVCSLYNQGPLSSNLLGDITATAVQTAKRIMETSAKVTKVPSDTATMLQSHYQFR